MHGWVGEPQSEDSGMTYGSTRTRTNVSNVLVIGSGAAGLRAAVAAHEAGSGGGGIGARPPQDAYTGRAMLFALVDKAESLGIPVHEGQYVSKLLVHDGRCFGAYAFDVQSGERTRYLSDAVVLATGGHTRLWRGGASPAGPEN